MISFKQAFVINYLKWNIFFLLKIKTRILGQTFSIKKKNFNKRPYCLKYVVYP